MRRTAFLKGRTTSGEDARMQAVDETAEKLAGRPGLSVYLDAESVVEDVVIAARGGCTVPSRANAGAAVLRKIVERTMAGERWNSSGPAMKGLACDCQASSADLLARFRDWAFAVPALGSPLPVYLEARRVVEELRAGRCDEPRNSGAKDGADPIAGWSRADQAELRAFLVLAASTR